MFGWMKFLQFFIGYYFFSMLGIQFGKAQTMIDTIKILDQKKLTQHKDSLLLSYQKKGYLDVHIEEDSLQKNLYVYKNNKLNVIALNYNNTQKIIKFENIEDYINQQKQALKDQGILFGDIQTTHLNTSNDTLFLTLQIKNQKKRLITGLVIADDPSFPNNFYKRLQKDFIKLPVTEQTLKRLNNFTQSMGFVSPTKFPEVLFTTDSTKVYVYTIKNKQNQAEGLVGFTNDDNNNLKWNGFLDISLINTLKQGETIHLDWNNNGFDQSNLNLHFELPYLGGSKFGLDTQLAIFRQDTTFQTTNLSFKVNYFLSYESRINLGIQSLESSNIQNLPTQNLDDFEATFYTLSYLYDYRREPVPRLLPKKFELMLTYGFGNRTSNTESLSQQKIEFSGAYRYEIDRRNSFYVRNHTRFLRSDGFLVNELYRFGGVNNIRGFVDNILQANFYSTLNTEYQFKLGSNFYVHSVIDYGYFEDATTNLKGNLRSFGFGFGLINNSNLFRFMVANGLRNQESFSLQNSVVHLSLRSFF